MGSLPNLHELGRAEEDIGLRQQRGGLSQCRPSLGHHYPILTSEERARILHRHSGHRMTKARSNGDGSRIEYDEFMLEKLADYSPLSNRSTQNPPTTTATKYLRRRESLNSSIGATSVRRLIAVVRSTSSRNGPVYTRRVLLRNLLMLCASHLLFTAAYLPFVSLQASVSAFTWRTPPEGVELSLDHGSLLLAGMYYGAAIGAMLAASVTQRVGGGNGVFFLGYVGFVVFYVVHAFGGVWVMVPVYLVVGVVLGLVTLARVGMLMTISGKLGFMYGDDDEDSKVSRRTCIIRRVARAFKASHDIGYILGSLFTALIISYSIQKDPYTTTSCSNVTAGGCTNSSDYFATADDLFGLDSSGERVCGSQACPHPFLPETNATGLHVRVLPSRTTSTLLGFYATAAALALFVAAAGFDRIRGAIYQEQGTQTLAKLGAVLESFRDVKLRLAAPLAVFIGLEQAFMFADFSKSYVVCTLGIHRLNYVFLCMGLLQSVAACTLSMLLRSIRRYYAIGVGFAFHACLLMVQLVWKPMEDDPALFFVISAAWGVCNAIWEIVNFTLLTGLYADNWEAAFANSYFFRYMGAGTVFLFHGLVCNQVKLYFLALFMVVATVPFAYLEVKLEGLRKVKGISRL